MASENNVKGSATAEALRAGTDRDPFTQKSARDKFKGGSIDYNVKSRVYPLETSINDDLQHYVAFFVNVRGKSKAFKEATGTAVNITGADSGSFDRERAGKRLQEGIGIAATAAGLALTQSLYAKVAANFGTASTKTKIIGNAAALVAGGIAANQIGEKLAELFQPDKRYRITDAIMLAMQERPSVRYGVEYMATDMGTLTGALAGGASGLALNEMLPEIARKGMLNLGQIPAAAAGMAVGENLDVKNLASVTSAMAPNPFREQIFQNVDTRTFTFDYKFLPKSQKESENIKEIIYTFAYHMHPELSAQGLFYIYPSEFNIQFFHQGRENLWVNKISTCVLTDMNVDYGNNSVFSTFANGAPTEINMRLTFRELEVLTKERIRAWHGLPATKI
jgi:hypothetical protein